MHTTLLFTCTAEQSSSRCFSSRSELVNNFGLSPSVFMLTMHWKMFQAQHYCKWTCQRHHLFFSLCSIHKHRKMSQACHPCMSKTSSVLLLLYFPGFVQEDESSMPCCKWVHWHQLLEYYCQTMSLYTVTLSTMAFNVDGTMPVYFGGVCLPATSDSQRNLHFLQACHTQPK